MMQLPARAGAAPVQTLATSLTELPFGSQTQIRVGGGQLAAFLAFAGYDRKIGTARYALRVLNNTPFAAQAKMFVEARGSQLSAYPMAFDIAPYSMRDDIVPVRMDVTGPYDRAIVQVITGESCFTVEAPPPPRDPPAWAAWCAIAALPIVLIAAAGVSRPRILDVVAPQKAAAGSVVRVPYQVSGIGSVEYDFDTRDGLQLAAGLTSQSGVLKLQIPHDGIGAPYTLHVRIRNMLASDERAKTIAAVAAPKPKTAAPPDGALIDALAVTPSPAQAGGPLVVRYATKAQSGDVWLLDAAGTTWAHSPLSHSGSTQLVIPKAAAGREMRVVLHAQRANAHAESSVGIAVLPSAQAVAKIAQPAKPKQSQVAAPELSVSPQVVSAGDTVTAAVSGVHGDVRITLMNANGATLSEGDVGEGGAVTLNAPNVGTPTAFFVVATFTSGVSQQSVMKRLTVTPR